MRLFAIAVLVAILTASNGQASDCSKTFVGFKPLTAPFFGAYQGMPGGLYPDGTNHRPAAHEALGHDFQATRVVPLDASGQFDQQNGRIVLLSIGMSNATQEFSAFQALANRDREKNPRVTIVDGAQGGWSADRIVADPNTYWSGVEQRLTAAGVTDPQVQAAWLKNADASPMGSFPASAQKLQSELKTIIQIAKARYPNLRLLYLSSRIYAGYATTNLNPEPYAYESGFAVKWLIEAQINGDPDLSFNMGKAPWIAWGPYLWADGVHARTDGLSWACADLADDGTHPSMSGQLKVARMLLDFFKSDSTTRLWFVGLPVLIQPPVPAAVVNAASYVAVTAPGAIASIFGTNLASTSAQASGLPLPYGLEGTSVFVGGEPAPLFAITPQQINFIVPPTAASNSVVVTREGFPSKALTYQSALYSEGLFTLDASGAGAAAALHLDQTLVTAQNPAQRGETIELFGTGKGVRNPAILAPELLPIIHIGSATTSAVIFYGPAPLFTGLDQINVTIPMDAPTGATVPVSVQLGSFMSNTATLAIASVNP